MVNSLILSLICALNVQSFNTTSKEFPVSVELMNLEGKKFDSSSFANENKYVFVDFWHSSCSPCMKVFDAVRDNLDEWNHKTNCKIIAVACQERNEQLIKLIESKEWPIEIYFDPDYELFKQLSRIHDKSDMQFSFPAVFVFDNKWQLIVKLKDAKLKFKDGFVPKKNVQPKSEVLVIDMDYYYKFFEKIRNE